MKLIQAAPLYLAAVTIRIALDDQMSGDPWEVRLKKMEECANIGVQSG